MPEPDVNVDPAAAVPPPPEGGSLIDEATGLIETAVTYVRQEANDIVREKVVQPIQSAGATVGLAIGVGLVLALGVGYVSVGALILLAQWLTWPGALFLIGGILIVGSAGIAYFRSRKMQP